MGRKWAPLDHELFQFISDKTGNSAGFHVKIRSLWQNQASNPATARHLEEGL
jgi:hypothetical protein